MKLHKILLTPPIVAISAALFCGALFAEGENTFEGTVDNDWFNGDNWSLGHVPQTDEAVVIDGKTVNVTNAITVGSLTLSGAAKLTVKANELTDYSVFETDAKATKALLDAACVVTIAGDFNVDDTAIVYPEAAMLTGVPVIFKVGRDFTLAEGASFDARTRGWGWSDGLWKDKPSTYCKPRRCEGNDIQANGWTLAFGSGLSYGTGGNYGGNRSATSWQSKTYAQTYGTAFAPWLPGSPSGNYSASVLGTTNGRGPGSIVVLAEGAAQINGKMNANGNANDNSGTSGGGIWLASSKFIFGAGAELSAIGGNCGNHSAYGPGYGGRIALAEGCTVKDIDEMLAGTLPDELLMGSSIELVSTDVRGGQNPNTKAYVASGTVAMVRPKSNQAILTVGSDVPGLVAAGVTFGDLTLTNGVYEMTAPEHAFLMSDGGVRYDCAGFAVSNATGEVSRGTDRTVRIEIEGREGPYSLTWHWTNRRVRVAGAIAGEGTVTYDGTTYTDTYDVYLPSGEPCEFAATPGEGWRFSSWAGTALPTGLSKDNPLVLTVTKSGTMDASFAQGSVSRVWVGPKGGSWDVANNWSPSGIPGDLDDLYLTNATLSVGHGLTVRSLTLSGASALTVNATPFAGESTPANIYANATVFEVTGALVVDGTSVLATANDPVTGAAVKIACGTFYLGPSAKMTANEQGWYWYAGTDDEYRRFVQGTAFQTRAMGSGNSYTQGGGYGADGGKAGGGYGKAYGYKYAPFLPGSPNGLHNNALGNGNHPGGTVWVKCAGLCELYGTVSANGKGNTSGLSMYGAASGGGVWICAKGVKATGTTSVTAIGGYLNHGGYDSYGAGGRVSVALGLTDEQLDALAAGEEPDGLTYTDAIDLFAVSVRGGERAGATPTYGNGGTATTVLGPLAYVSVTIAGTPVNALGVQPDNGLESYEGGTVQTFTAPEYGVDPVDPTVRYACEGYVVTDASGEVKRGEGTAVDVKMGNGPMSVIWQWGASQKRVLVRKPEHGSLTIDGVAADGDAITWTTGRTAALGAVPDEGYEFVCWEGNVPFGQARENPLVATIPKPLDVTPVFRLAEAPTERTWSGMGVWTDASKWSPANIPGSQDTVVIASGTCTVSNSLTVAALRMTGSALNVGTKGPVSAELSVSGDVEISGGTVKFGIADLDGHVRVDIGGDLALSGAAKLYVYGGVIEGEYTHATGASWVNVGGALTLDGTSTLYPVSSRYTGGSVVFRAETVSVGATATVNADEAGYRWLDGVTPPLAPGIGYSYSQGGSHGGLGKGAAATKKYGFANAPIEPGSPNGNYNESFGNCYNPGGLIRIHARTMSVGGTLTASAKDGSLTFGGPSGGGIWLTADRFDFAATAVLAAHGGQSNYDYSMGGGGRIAVSTGLTEAQYDSLVTDGTIRRRKVYDVTAFTNAFPGVTVDVRGGAYNGDATKRAGEGTFTYLPPPPGLMLLVK